MPPGAATKNNNILPLWGNDKTMNLNNLILTNIQSSHYFKVNLFDLKTYHEVIDEIYYKVTHLEPWEKGSRKTSGQTGMCGGVRGVGAGGIVSTAFCLLYKLFTLKLTRKQVNGLITHCDSPFIRALGFMYIRYTQPPPDLWDWYEQYLDDEEELDVKAGGGCVMTIGEMLRHYLTKLEWYSTLFPRIPVPIQKDIEKKLSAHGPLAKTSKGALGKDGPAPGPIPVALESRHIPDNEVSWGEAERISRSASRERKVRRDDKRENGKKEDEKEEERSVKDDKREERKEERREETRREDKQQREDKRDSRSTKDSKTRRERESGKKSSDRDRREDRDKRSDRDIADDIAREKERQKNLDREDRSRSRSRTRDRRHRSRSRDRRYSRSHSKDRSQRDRHYRSRSRDRHRDRRSRSRSRERR